MVFPLAALSQTDRDKDTGEEVINLTPFEVTTDRDYGYLSTNSTAGTSLNMLIRDIPMSLEVINREMLDDMQATNLEEALIYSAGVFTDNYRTNTTATPGFSDQSPSAVGSFSDPFQNSISIRGYNVPNQQRSGFRVGFIHNTAGVVIGGTTDGILTERTEVVRGPQSLLYGINVLSGITNIVPKRPLPEFGTRLSLMVGSDNEFRTTLDVTGPVIDKKLNFRILAAFHRFDDHMQVDFREFERQTIGLQFEYLISPRTRLYVEYINATRESRGIGASSFSITGSLLNPYGEAFRFGRDDPRTPIWIRDSKNQDGERTHELYDVYFQDHDLSSLGGSSADGQQDGPFIPKPGNEEYYDFSDRGHTFNISGPDTFKTQNEQNILAQLYHNFTKDLSLEAGFLHSKMEIEERNVSLHAFFNRDGTILPSVPRAFPPESTWNPWQQNPEVKAAGGLNDKFGYGIGEAFVFSRANRERSNIDPAWYETTYYEPLPAGEAVSTNKGERAYAYYHWYDKPASAESTQLRLRLAYNFQTEFFNIPGNHTLVGGFHYIEDQIDFISGSGNPEQFYSAPTQVPLSTSPYPGKTDSDPINFRVSVFDTSIIRLKPTDMVPMAGNINYSNLGGLSATSASTGGVPSSIARSGRHEDSFWFRGFYGIYRGQFWNDKLTVIAGIRHDIYQGKEKEQLVIIDRSNDWASYQSGAWLGGNTLVHDPNLPGIYGNKPWEPLPRYSDALNQSIATSIDNLRYKMDENGDLIPNMVNGTIEHIFDKSQTFTTHNFGISYRIIDPLSVYVAYSEGVFPNVGIRDGADNAVGPEQTRSKEIGFRFDLFEGKFSGTISFWQINRENAVTQWNYAPAPARYHGGTQGPSSESNSVFFSPINLSKERTFARPEGSTFEGGNLDPGNPADVAKASPYRGGQYFPLGYGIDVRYIELAMEQLGYEPPSYGGTATIGDFAQFNTNGEFIDDMDGPANISTDVTNERRRWFIIDYEKALKNADPEKDVLKRAFDLAMSNAQVHGVPTEPGNVFSGPLVNYNGAGILWWEGTNHSLENPSSRNPLSVPVTFEEEGQGIDGQFIFTPTPAWQIVFSFSHQERGLSGKGLNLIDPVAEDGEGNSKNWGTEYDVWTYLLGAENFTDPSRPSTFTGESVRGLDLSFVPRDSFALLTRYSFRDEILEGLTVGAGVQYEGEVITHTTIGGTRLEENIFVPPPRPDRYVFNVFFRYRWDMARATWSLQLNVNNIFDHDEDEVVNEYASELDTPIFRRTLVRYTPRVWRISLSADF